jgi:PAS domain S-box-containing protein
LSGRLDGIGWRLLTRVLFFSSAITLLLTVTQLYFDYRRDVGAIDQRMGEIDSGYRQSLGDGLWRMDVRQLQLQVEGILRLPDIRYVELREATNQADPLVVRAGARQASPPVRRQFSIFYENRGTEQLLGILVVEATYDQIYRRLLGTAAVILVSRAIQTFMVSFFILFVVHQLITRDLTGMARSLRQFDFRNSRAPLKLRRPAPRAPDELDDLVAAFNQMYARLQAAYTELQLQVGLLQHLPVFTWTLRPDGTPDFVNQVWLEFAGQTPDFVRSHPEAWMTAIHPDDRETAGNAFWQGVQSGQDFAMEYRSLRARDGTYRWLLSQAVVLRDAEGRILKFAGTTTDIDDQKRSEEAWRQAQGDLARINRVTTMGELAASLAHEINQPISGAVINASVVLRKLGHDEPNLDEVRADTARILRDAHRAADILKRVRAQFEKGTPNRELVDVNEIVRETVALLRGEAARYDVSVRTELAADLPRITADPVQLQQVAMNLIVNGIEAMKNVAGKREIAITSRRGDDGQILLSFSDTGTGFSPEVAQQIFDPFYTTKSHGTGMGLRISRSIIEAHEGRMWAESVAGHGATFHLNLPATQDA